MKKRPDRSEHSDKERLVSSESKRPALKIISRASLEEKSREPAPSERSESRGFTLIELLVVIAIMAFLVVAAISSLSRSRTSREVKTTAENLRNFLTEARAMAMNPGAASFGTKKITIRINIDGNQTIKMYEEETNLPSFNKELSPNLKPPNKIKIIPPEDSNPKWGNTTCLPNSNPNNPDFCYFSFLAKEQTNPPRSIGQITDSKNQNKPILINVEDSSGAIKFQLTIDHLTGNIGIENIP